MFDILALPPLLRPLWVCWSLGLLGLSSPIKGEAHYWRIQRKCFQLIYLMGSTYWLRVIGQSHTPNIRKCSIFMSCWKFKTFSVVLIQTTKNSGSATVMDISNYKISCLKASNFKINKKWMQASLNFEVKIFKIWHWILREEINKCYLLKTYYTFLVLPAEKMR